MRHRSPADEPVIEWRAADPAAAAARLSVLLGRTMEVGVPCRLGPAWLRVDPAPGTREERLALIAPRATAGAPPTRARPGAAPPRSADEPTIVAIGWATIDLDRAASSVLAEARPHDGRATASLSRPGAHWDESLGARSRFLPGHPGGLPVVLLEPSTEGRLAASLARFGEGPAALYVRVGSVPLRSVAERIGRSGLAVGRVDLGPLGEQLLAPSSRPWGPHVLLVGPDDRPLQVATADPSGCPVG